MAKMKDTAATTTYADHEVILPENKLRKVIITGSPDDNPVERAEDALEAISSEFGPWMNEECERLDRARQAIAEGGFTQKNKDALFLAAHDIKGQAATFGFPLIAPAANSLCRLIEHTPDSYHIPISLVEQHVDAMRAIYREHGRPEIKELASQLIKRLRDVTDEFLISENRDRPDVLKQILRPSIVPE